MARRPTLCLLIRLFRPAGQLLQVRYACFVIVNSGSHDVWRIAGFEGIADLSRTLLFARFWPPVLDPNSGRSLCSLAELREQFGPLGASQSGSVLADEIRPNWMGGYGCFDAVDNKNIGVLPHPGTLFFVELRKPVLARLRQSICGLSHFLPDLLRRCVFLSCLALG